MAKKLITLPDILMEKIQMTVIRRKIKGGANALIVEVLQNHFDFSHGEKTILAEEVQDLQEI